MQNIIAIVVTYNRLNLLEECIQSLLEQKNANLDIMIINNNSTDNTEEVILKKYKNKVIYFNTGENIGGAGGFNFGLKKAYESNKNYDFFWLMDDDTIPNSNVLKTVVEFTENKSNIGFISTMTLWTDNSLCEMNRQVLTNGKLITESTKNGSLLKKCTFVSCFVSREAVVKCGLPIKEFFIWSDDSEYTSRISKQFNCYYINSCFCIHKMKNNNCTNIVKEDGERIDRYFYFYRNRYYIARRDGFKAQIRYRLMILKHKIKIIFMSNNKLKKIKIINKGYTAGVKFLPNVEYMECEK